jgi:hypothetical protein
MSVVEKRSGCGGSLRLPAGVSCPLDLDRAHPRRERMSGITRSQNRAIFSFRVEQIQSFRNATQLELFLLERRFKLGAQ